MSYESATQLAAFAEDATLNTCDSDGFKRVETAGWSLSSIIYSFAQAFN
jgi:hypothetical protein